MTVKSPRLALSPEVHRAGPSWIAVSPCSDQRGTARPFSLIRNWPRRTGEISGHPRALLVVVTTSLARTVSVKPSGRPDFSREPGRAAGPSSHVGGWRLTIPGLLTRL